MGDQGEGEAEKPLHEVGLEQHGRVNLGRNGWVEEVRMVIVVTVGCRKKGEARCDFHGFELGRQEGQCFHVQNWGSPSRCDF